MSLGDIVTRASSLFSGIFGNKPEKYTPGSFEIKDKHDRIAYIDNEFDRYAVKDRENYERCERNWKMYSGFNNGQWPEEAVSVLEQENRNILQFNLVRKKVDGLAGSIAKNWYDVDYQSTQVDYIDETILMKELFYADKEQLDWNASYLEAIRDGLIYRAVEQMVISERYAVLGNIGFERTMPGHVMLDPTWLTSSGWDLRKLFKIAYLDPKQMMNKYESKSDEIQKQVELMARIGSEFGNNNDAGFPHYNYDQVYGHQYRVIEYHHVEQEKKKTEFTRTADGRMVTIPDGSDEYKRNWCIENSIDCSDGVISIDYPVDTYYVSTICKQLDPDNFLEDRKARIQIGRLPFFVWSAARINGTDSGVVDLLVNVQETLNKRESLVDNIIATASSGNFAYDPLLFGNDIASMEDMERKMNRPSEKFRSAPGEISSGRKHFEQVPKPQFPTEVINELNRMIDYFDNISGLTPSMEGRQESSKETGVLFARKQMQSEIMQTVMLRGLEQYTNEKAEGYMLLAQQLYSGIYREIKAAGSNRSIKLNETIYSPEGVQIKNDISRVPRCKVIVTQSPEGVTVRAVERSQSAELLAALPQEMTGSRALLTSRIMQSLDGKKEDRQRYIETSEKEYALAMGSIDVQLLGIELQKKNLQQQLANSGQQPMGEMAEGVEQASEPQGGPPIEQQSQPAQ